MSERQDEIREDGELPSGVVEGLRGAYGVRGQVEWRGQDGAVMAAFGTGRRRGGWRRGAVAAVLAVMIGGGVWWRMDQGYVRTGDIRDAFYVARAVEAGRGLDKGWDVNGDGKVDGGDVRVLAMAAVRVER